MGSTGAAVPQPSQTEAAGPKGETTRKQIFEIALDLFSSRGYHATSMQAIAERTGLLKGSLYYYIKSKDELLIRLLEHSIDDVMDRMRAAEAAGGAPFEALEAIISAEMHAIAEHQREIWIWQIERRQRQAVLEAIDAKARIVDDILRRAVRGACLHRTEVSDSDINLAFRATQGLITSFTGWYRPAQYPDLEHIVRQYCDFALRIADFRRPEAIRD